MKQATVTLEMETVLRLEILRAVARPRRTTVDEPDYDKLDKLIYEACSVERWLEPAQFTPDNSIK